MGKWQIESKAGLVFGVYEGKTGEDAFAAMVAEAGGSSGAEGDAYDWIITEYSASDRMDVAIDWYNSASKADLLQWATAHGLDVGQNNVQLDADWNERVIDAYAETL